MSFQEEEIIVLIDEDENEIEFEIIEIFETTANDNKYAFLFPLDEDEESIIMKIVLDEDDEEILVEIDDDQEWEEVIQAWEDYISELEEEE